mgnify:CR=1 FL=1|tara:strand:- start:209 stop:427 length:219 start_codon:yes stop_codon:yes gene_type:complete
MISAALGMVIMSAATVAMLVALNITTDQLKKAGRYNPTKDERILLEKAGFNNAQIKSIEAEIDQLNFGKIQN